MRDRIDPLIAERAPWLFSQKPWAAPSRHALTKLLAYNKTLHLADQLKDQDVPEIVSHMSQMLAKKVTVKGLENLPKSGAALVVANHPTGIADGIILNSVLSGVRSDAYFYANSDILRVLPQLEPIIAPVEWRIEKRSHAKTRSTMAYTKAAVEQGRLGVIFPSGRLAKRRGLALHERPWMASAAMIARKYNLDVIPVNIRARNSVLFYLFDFIHPTLRDITLFYETLNKNAQPFHIKVGEPIPAASIPTRSEDGIEMLRTRTLNLGGDGDPAVSLLKTSQGSLLNKLGHLLHDNRNVAETHYP